MDFIYINYKNKVLLEITKYIFFEIIIVDYDFHRDNSMLHCMFFKIN